MPEIKQRKPRNFKNKKYLNNHDMLAEFTISKANDRMSENLGKMSLLLAKKYCTKSSFSGYETSMKEDMICYACLQICRYWRSFNPEKSTNLFAYLTSIIHNAFIYQIGRHYKHRTLIDKLNHEQGNLTTWAFENE